MDLTFEDVVLARKDLDKVKHIPAYSTIAQVLEATIYRLRLDVPIVYRMALQGVWEIGIKGDTQTAMGLAENRFLLAAWYAFHNKSWPLAQELSMAKEKRPQDAIRRHRDAAYKWAMAHGCPELATAFMNTDVTDTEICYTGPRIFITE